MSAEHHFPWGYSTGDVYLDALRAEKYEQERQNKIERDRRYQEEQETAWEYRMRYKHNTARYRRHHIG